MRRTLRSMLFLTLAVCTLTMTTFADSGPKPQLVIKVNHAPQEPYVLDLLEEGIPDDRSAMGERYFLKELEELGVTDPELYYDLIAEVPAGWRACLAQPIAGPPVNGKLTGSQSGDIMLHSFGYHVPDTYKILLVTESNEVWISDSYTRTALQSTVTIDWETKVVSMPSAWVGYVLQFLATFIPTLFMEGALLFTFQYFWKRSWLIFFVINLITQGALSISLSIEAVQGGVGWGFMSLFLMAEFAVFLVEAVAYVILLKEHSKELALSYALAANTLSAVIGWFLSEPVWKFVVSIS